MSTSRAPEAPRFPPYLAGLSDRGATLQHAHFQPAPVRFSSAARGPEAAYVARLEWPRAELATGPRVVVMRASTGYPVCMSLPGRLLDVDPSTVNLDTCGDDELDRLAAPKRRQQQQQREAQGRHDAERREAGYPMARGVTDWRRPAWHGPEIGANAPAPAWASGWRNGEGKTLAEALGEFIRVHRGRLPCAVEDAAAIEAARLDVAGFFRPGDHEGRGGAYLLTLATLAAFVAEQGISAVTPAELHTACAELVEAGHLGPRVEVHSLPGLGLVWCYVVAADVAELR